MVGDCPIHERKKELYLFWHIGTLLFGHISANLLWDLNASLSRNLVAFFPWHLFGYLHTLLPGDILALDVQGRVLKLCGSDRLVTKKF